MVCKPEDLNPRANSHHSSALNANRSPIPRPVSLSQLRSLPVQNEWGLKGINTALVGLILRDPASHHVSDAHFTLLRNILINAMTMSGVATYTVADWNAGKGRDADAQVGLEIDLHRNPTLSGCVGIRVFLAATREVILPLAAGPARSTAAVWFKHVSGAFADTEKEILDAFAALSMMLAAKLGECILQANDRQPVPLPDPPPPPDSPSASGSSPATS